MTKMRHLTALEYLSQLKILDIQIDQDIERLSEMKLNAIDSGAIDYSKERVQTSQSGDKLCKEVVNYVNYGEKINQEIDEYVAAKEQIIREIRELRNAEYIQVLYKVYVQYKNLKTAAVEMQRSYNNVILIHKQALKEFKNLHPRLYYLC